MNQSRLNLIRFIKSSLSTQETVIHDSKGLFLHSIHLYFIFQCLNMINLISSFFGLDVKIMLKIWVCVGHVCFFNFKLDQKSREPSYKSKIEAMRLSKSNTMFIDFSHVMQFNDVLQKVVSNKYLRYFIQFSHFIIVYMYRCICVM